MAQVTWHERSKASHYNHFRLVTSWGLPARNYGGPVQTLAPENPYPKLSKTLHRDCQGSAGDGDSGSDPKGKTGKGGGKGKDSKAKAKAKAKVGCS